MTVKELAARLREIMTEERELVREGCALQTWLREYTGETTTYSSRLVTSLVPEMNSELGRLRVYIAKLEKMDGGTVCDEGLLRAIPLAEGRLAGYRESIAAAKREKFER